MRRVLPGAPEPLGLTLTADGANVAVQSAHARAIELCLFDATGAAEVERIALPARTGDVFHGFVADLRAGQRYGLRAHGRWAPDEGQRFNPAKLLLDPYARALDRAFAFDPLQCDADARGGRDPRDSAATVPKAVATPAFAAAAGPRPQVRWSDTIVYELHVRGFTRQHPQIPAAIAGTCAALAHPAAIAHLAALGVTTIELMPLAAASDEPHLARAGLANHWGYNPVGLLVPDPRLAPGGIAEVRAAVTALHAAGFEVLLDVVLNHSGEGDRHGPSLSLRGLDNATYYRHAPGAPAQYVNDTGCGNTLALDRPPVLRLALDALRYWVLAAGVDGFRFDLATTLGRRADGFDAAAPFFAAIDQDPLLRELKLVAEPWDVGPGGYQAGAFPARWSEWNDRFRDTARRVWRGDRGLAGECATRLAGSADVFAARHRPPSRSVNFVAAHDGFTLADVVAFERKHNAANGEDNRDGTDANHSWNHGVEGPTTDPGIVAARAADVRALLALLFVARGTPMLAMGDELGRTQRGNNNAYAQDNPLAWIDWNAADRDLVAFTGALARLRGEHRALHRDAWLAGEPVDASGIPDVEWRHPDGRAFAADDWHAAAPVTLAAALYAPADDDGDADRVVVALNAGPDATTLALPAARDGFAWHRRLDSTDPAGAGADNSAAVAADAAIAWPARSVLLFAERPAPRRAPRGVDPAALAELAAAAGIVPEWWDLGGTRYDVGDPTRGALLAAMGLAVVTTADARDHLATLAARRERRALPVCLVGAVGTPLVVPLASPQARTLHVQCADGTTLALPVDADALPSRRLRGADGRSVVSQLFTLAPLPPGLHALHLDDDTSTTARVLVAPRACHLPPALAGGGRSFGLAAHLYALRRAGDQGCGDFTTLADAARATAAAGGALVGLNPLHALFAEDRDRASPYHPADRRFVDPIYLDVEAEAAFAAAPAARERFARHAATLAALAAAPAVDYAGVWAVKRDVLAACHAAFAARDRHDPAVAAFRSFVAAGGASLRTFAVFSALAAAHPDRRWPDWPAALRRPDAAAVAAFAASHGRDVDFALYLQWRADAALATAAADAGAAGLALGFYRDLAVGAAPDGAEAWADPAGLARGVSIGAPPDPFSRSGQVWCLPPPIPDAMADGGYAAFRALLAANMRHAGALRIDHVMGLARLFWVPDGASAAEGAYVRYPVADLVGALAFESARARCLVVGEDLGTVPEGLRERLAAASVLSYRVLWFERDGGAFRPAAAYPQLAAACVSTHDLPTIRGWWDGADLDERARRGADPPAAAVAARIDRAADRAHLLAALAATGAPAGGLAADDVAVAAAIHRFVAATPAALVLVQADDLAGETEALNVPGTDRERPNWRRKVGVVASGLWTTPIGVAAARDLAPRRVERGDADAA